MLVLLRNGVLACDLLCRSRGGIGDDSVERGGMDVELIMSLLKGSTSASVGDVSAWCEKAETKVIVQR